MPCPSHPPWLDHSNYTWCLISISILCYHLCVGHEFPLLQIL
jgi:hypothetical protein